MRLSGLGPGPSLFISNSRQNSGQVNEDNNIENNNIEGSNGLKGQKNQETNQDPTIESKGQGAELADPLDDPEVRAQVMELQTVEDKVIAHERAHQAAGGEFTGAASYGYTMGPDGKRYITSGEVSISVPSSGEPEEQLRAMERVRAAALAPADPSGQDQSVAGRATAKMAKIRTDIARQKATDAYGNDEKDPSKNEALGDISGMNEDVDPESPLNKAIEDRMRLDLMI
ncbi:putative metalloprotease CJM1_0395 family protein [Fusibacter sp. JL216-2]|uniref:putative metalloprotease CJM1_0395 family protein n=1 Tax=Fusibacter sp. JL216-2 TaxID=3071453 RepID=UPI003D33EC65